MASPEKAPGAFRTIGELSQELGVAQHILRYWETKFPQLKPLQRAGNRRYYRPSDVELAHKIHSLLNQDGYTVRGVQKLLRNGTASEMPENAPDSAPSAPEQPEQERKGQGKAGVDLLRLVALRNRLASALEH